MAGRSRHGRCVLWASPLGHNLAVKCTWPVATAYKSIAPMVTQMEPAQAESAHRGASAQSQFNCVKITSGNRYIPASLFGSLILSQIQAAVSGRPDAR